MSDNKSGVSKQGEKVAPSENSATASANGDTSSMNSGEETPRDGEDYGASKQDALSAPGGD